MSVLEARSLPYSLEAETAVLGAVMLVNSNLPAVAAALVPDDFYRDGHKRIFRSMLALDQAGSAIDLVTLKDHLRSSGDLDAAGGLVYLSSLVDGTPRSTNIDHYTAIVLDRSRLRRVILASTETIAHAYEAEDSAAEVLARADRRLFELTTGTAKAGFRKIGDILPSVLEQVEQWQAKPGEIRGITSGLVDLDATLCGLQAGKLYVVAARPGMGKSAMAIKIALAAGRQNRTVLMFSLEMSDEEYVLRALSSEARINAHAMQRGQMRQTDYGRLAQAMGEIGDLPIYIDDDPNVTAASVRAQARRLQQTAGLDLVIVDYTQLMLSSDRSENRAIEVGNITRALKALSKELSIPVVTLAQLNRELERRDDKRPKLSDMRDSGRIEEDADVVVFIYRDEFYTKDQCKEPGVAELLVAKHRGGPMGMVKVKWCSEETRFDNLDEQHQAPADMRLPMGDR